MRPSRRSRSAALSPPPRRGRGRSGLSPRAFIFSVATSGSLLSRGGVGIAVVASAGSAGGWSDDCSRGICSARVSSADGCGGGVGPAPRGSPVFPPRTSLSQDSISRSSPRPGGGGPCGGAGGRPVDRFGCAEKRVVGASFGSGRPAAGILVVPAAEGASGAGGRNSGRGGGATGRLGRGAPSALGCVGSCGGRVVDVAGGRVVVAGREDRARGDGSLRSSGR